MAGFSIGELVLLLAVLFLAIGPARLPETMRALGTGLRQFLRAMNEARDAMGRPEGAGRPAPPPPDRPASLRD